MQKTFLNWSGGKDSSMTLFYLLQNTEVEVEQLFTSMNKEQQRISMHGVRRDLLEKQAASIGLPLRVMELSEKTDMEGYRNEISKHVDHFVKEDFEATAFGDIFLEDLKKYREEQLAPTGLKVHFPLWKRDTTELMRTFIDLGFKSIVTCVNEKFLDKSFVGRVLDDSFLADLPPNVDPCGENGEYHSFAFDGPIFNEPITFELGEVVYRKYDQGEDADLHTGFWFQDLI